ncbi:hypothetical protein ACIBFB_01845 [Nocardiopsis sp. NPDC050513]|uniref:hypothetical protein n=1 Tax=Nocardiopsis sp. NPDC050513 TaxID=3364338 RepID=UPI0037A8E255
MKFNLADGTTVRITAVTSRAVRAAVPVPGRPGVLRLRGRTPGEAVRDLAEQRLAVRDRHLGVWVLTQRGAGVRELLDTAPGVAVGDADDGGWGGQEPTRLTVHPEVDDATAAHLDAAALRRHQPPPRPPRPARPPASPPRVNDHWIYPVGGAALVAAGLVLVAAVGGLVLLPILFVAVFVAGAVAVAKAISTSVSKSVSTPAPRQVQEAADREWERRLLLQWRDWYVGPDALDTEARALLARTQSAVDAVLASSLHDQGLLLDAVRNRVVLADVEWAVADRLRGHTRTRRTMASTPTPGEHSLRAAARAREVLDQDVARVEARVRVLEDYAAKVRAAEMERFDRQAAERLDALAVEAGVDHEQQDEALSSLVQAQELALRVASLTDELLGSGPPGGPEPPGSPEEGR